MPRFSDELLGSEGEWCKVDGRRAIIRAVHDQGEKATIQFEDDDSTKIVFCGDIKLEGEEKP